MSPPDWNWADFCGAQLLAVWVDHRQRLPQEVQELVQDSILHAAHSIKKRNVGPGYTNIAIMGTYVTRVASEQFDHDELREYSKKRLRDFYDYTIERGSFNEYNSSTYSIVALAEIARMLMHFTDEEDLKRVHELHDLGWKHVARHFHVPTRQWSGPQSRCYQTDLRERSSALAFLEAGTGANGWITKSRPLSLGLTYYRLPINCPEKYWHLFRELPEPRYEVETFSPGRSMKKGEFREGDTAGLAIIGSTFQHPQYSLGTVNYGDFWNQRRPFLVYWGTREQPRFLRVRFLHDGYDYTSALVFTRQDKNHTISAVVFATDYGDTHPSLDKVQNATIRAKDLRLRFEFGGDVKNLGIQENPLDNSLRGLSPDRIPPTRKFMELRKFTILDDQVRMMINGLAGRFGDETFTWETGEDDELKYIDAVAYSGEEKAIDFNTLRNACIAFTFLIQPLSEKMSDGTLKVQQQNQKISLEYLNMGLELSSMPATRKEIQNSVVVW
jgi:hypothetical protein